MISCPNHKAFAHNKIRLLFSIILIGMFMLIEAIGAVLSNSMALLTDAAHMLTDFIALCISWGAQHYAQKRPNHKYTFGYSRLQIVTTLITGLVLFGIVFVILSESIDRSFETSYNVNWSIMLITASIGLTANTIIYFTLHTSPGKNLSIRSTMLHIMGDILGSISAIIAAIVIKYTEWMRIDLFLSIIIAIFLSFSAYNLAKEAMHVLLEGAPKGIDELKIKELLIGNFNIIDIQEVRVWMINDKHIVATMHLALVDGSDPIKSFDYARRELKEKLHIAEVTFEQYHKNLI